MGIDQKWPASLTCLGILGLKRTVSSLGDEYQTSSGVVLLAAVFISLRNAVGEESCVTRQKRLRGRLTQGTLSVYLKPRWPPVTLSALSRRSYTILPKHRGLWTVYTVTEVGFLSQLMREDSIFVFISTGKKRNSLVHWISLTVLLVNRPLALRGHVTNASFKQWVGILLMPKIDRAH